MPLYTLTPNNDLFEPFDPNNPWGASGITPNTVQGGEGNDTILTGAANDMGLGGAGNDIIFGVSGNDTIFGEDGDDTLDGSNGNDSLLGGEGADTYVVEFIDFGTETITDNDGKIFVGSAAIGSTELLGYELKGNASEISEGVYRLNVGGVNHILEWAGEGTDLRIYEEGSDAFLTRVIVKNYTNGTFDLTLGEVPHVPIYTLTEGNDVFEPFNPANEWGASAFEANTIYALGGNDTVISGLMNDTVEGGEGNDFLFGSSGSDSLQGQAGDDVLDAGTGNDTLVGGEGDDTFVIDFNADFGQKTISDSDGIIFQGGAAPGGTNLIGNAISGAAVAIQGQSGAYEMTVNGQDYTLTQDGGNLDINRDNVSSAQMTVTVNDYTNGAFGISLFTPDIRGTDEADDRRGTNASEVIATGAGNDTIAAMGGNDTVIGGSGNDDINGGNGKDLLFGGDGNDSFNSAWEGGDTVHGEAGNDSYSTFIGSNDFIGGDGDDKSTTFIGFQHFDGGAGNDTFTAIIGGGEAFGGEGNDQLLVGISSGGTVLDGGAGDDTLHGGVGTSTLTGGDDNDLFIADFAPEYNGLLTNKTFITDFDMELDTLIMFNLAADQASVEVLHESGNTNLNFMQNEVDVVGSQVVLLGVTLDLEQINLQYATGTLPL